MPHPIDQYFRRPEGGLRAEYTLTLFESCADDHWFMGECGYKTLWQKVFDLQLTDEEWDAILDGNQPFALSSEGKDPEP